VERLTEKQTDRQTDRRTDTKTEGRQTDRQTDTQADRQNFNLPSIREGSRGILSHNKIGNLWYVDRKLLVKRERERERERQADWCIDR